jgi:hypothetical protein
MPAWTRISPMVLQALTKTTWHRKSGHMVMATAAKKHITFFARKREAPHAGRDKVKDAFTAAAAKTRAIAKRSERNAIIKKDVTGTGSGEYHRVSRSKYGPLAGTVYTVKIPYKAGLRVKAPTSFVGV